MLENGCGMVKIRGIRLRWLAPSPEASRSFCPSDHPQNDHHFYDMPHPGEAM